VKTGDEYKQSLRLRNIKVYVKGQLLKSEDVIDHPFIRGHVNSAALTNNSGKRLQKTRVDEHRLSARLLLFLGH